MVKFRWETEFKKTEIGEISKEWNIIKLGRLANIKTGKTNVQDAVDNGKYPLFDRSGKLKRSNKYLFDTEAVIVPGEGKDFFPKYYIGKFDLHQRTYVIFNFKPELKGKYLYFAVFILRHYLKEWAVGSTVLSLRLPIFKQLPIPLPPPTEQSRIATVLSWFDDLIENKKRQNEILEKTAMAIFKSWFVDFEPFKDEEFVYNEDLNRKVPKGWEVKGLGIFTEIIMGQSPSSKYYNEQGKGLPFIQGKGQYGEYIPETTIYCSKFLKIAKPNDILVTVRAPVGELNLADREYIIGRGVASLRNKYWSFLFLYLLSDNERLKSYERGTTYDAITKEELDSFPLLLPPQPILEKFHSLVEPLFQKIILNQKQIMVLRKVRDALLPQLVFGKLRVEEI